MITLGKITIEGFGNIATIKQFNFDRLGLNILNSPNGKGKTTIFSALCWVLYGKSLKNKSQVETWEDKRPKDFKGTIVGINIHSDTNIQIWRCIKYKGKVVGASGASRLVIIENSKELNFKDKVEAQKWITKKLGMSFELFKNSVVFGQKMKRFIEEDGPTKKQIFEEVFDTSYIQVAKEIAISERDGLSKDLTEQEKKLTELEIRVEGLERLEKTHQENLKTFKVNRDLKLGKLRDKFGKIKKEILSLEDKYKPNWLEVNNNLHLQLTKAKDKGKLATELGNEAFKLDLANQKNQAEYEGSKRVRKHFYTDLSKKDFKCSLCKQKLSPKHQALHIKELKANIQLETKKQLELEPLITEGIDRYNGLVKQVNEIKLKSIYLIPELEKKIDGVKSDVHVIMSLAREKRQLIKEINGIKNEVPNTLNLEKVKKELKTLNGKREPINLRFKELTNLIGDCDWVIKDPLSNSGIKSYIFSQMVKKVNIKLRQYSNIINGEIKFGIDLDSGNRDFYITLEREEYLRFYPDLSGGEQQLVNICIAFAMYDTISETNPFNLLVLDECFENLDNSNTEVVGELIKSKSKGKSLFVITHRSSFIPNGSRIITI